MLCEGFKWNHLPMNGGLYAQHPKFIDDMEFILGRRNEYEHRKHKEEEMKNRPKRPRGRL